MIIGNVTVDKFIFPLEIEYLINQSVGISTSGSVQVADFGTEQKFFVVKLDKKNRTTLTALKNYIRDAAKYSLNTITITPDSNIDLGNGNGVAVTVRYWGDKFSYKIENNDQYNFDFKFRIE